MKLQPQFQRKQKVDDFILEEPLGGGQDGEVWRATRTSIGKSCAIKFLNSVDEADKKLRFDREIKILASLDHPNIVQIQDKGDAWNPQSGATVPYYVMEFLPGQPIHKALKEIPKHARLEAFCILFQQVCSALAAAHALGISHGDVKPANVLVLGKDRFAKLSDFGFGLLPGESKEPRNLYPNSSYKAPQTLTPEQADIYRLGKTARECLDELSDLPESEGYREIVSLATRISEARSDISLSEIASILEQIRTTTFSKVPAPEIVTENVPELSPLPNEGKLISDPVHGVRNFSIRCIHIIDQPFFQRLREIRKFPSAELVFPALTITAFEEALGEHSMLIRQLESFSRTAALRETLTPKQLSCTILAGLLMGAARMPFHSALSKALYDDLPPLQDRVFELVDRRITKVIEDEWKIDVGLLKDTLVEYRPPYEESAERRLVFSILHGPLSASTLDWVFRAPARAGMEAVAHINEVLGALTVWDGQIVVRDGGLRSLEAFYLARIQALERLFYQSTIRAADVMLQHAFLLLKDNDVDFSKLIGFTDFEFFNSCLTQAKKQDNKTALNLLTSYKNRNLHKRVLSIKDDVVRELFRYRLSHNYRRDLTHRIAEYLQSHLRIVLPPGSVFFDIPDSRRRREIFVLVDGSHLVSASTMSPSFAALEEWPSTQHAVLYASPDVNVQLQPHIEEIRQVIEHVILRNTNGS